MKKTGTGASLSTRKKSDRYYTVGALLNRRHEAHALEICNLRADTLPDGAQALIPVGDAERLVVPAGWQAVYKFDNVYLLINEEAVAAFDGTRIAEIGRLPGRFRCAVNLSAKECLLMFSGGRARAVYADGEISLKTERRDYPPLRFETIDTAAISAGVGARKLSTAYGTEPFSKCDAAALSADMADAYERIVAESALAGVFVQPVLARYKLYGIGGELLFVSPPVLLSRSDGSQCADYKELYSSDRRNVDAYTLTAGTWQAELYIPGGEEIDEVSRAEVYISPAFHPYHPDFRGNVYAGRSAGAQTPFARVSLPGRMCGLIAGSKSSQAILERALARMDAVERHAATILRPFDGTSRRMTLTPGGGVDAAGTARTFYKALKKPVYHTDYLTVMSARPHLWSAGCGALSSDAAAWGDLAVHRYEGYSASIFGSGTADGVWRSISIVRFADGSSVIRREEGNGAAPTALNAVISYPSPDAVEMTVILYCKGANHKAVYALCPDASGKMSYAVSENFLRRELPLASAVQNIDTEAKDLEFPRILAYSRSNNPFTILHTMDTGSRVCGLTGRAGSDGAWEFGRARFIAACRGGIFSTGVNMSSGAMALRAVSNGLVERNDALCRADTGDVYTACNGRIIRISKSGNITDIANGRDRKSVV